MQGRNERVACRISHDGEKYVFSTDGALPAGARMDEDGNFDLGEAAQPIDLQWTLDASLDRTFRAIPPGRGNAGPFQVVPGAQASEFTDMTLDDAARVLRVTDANRANPPPGSENGQQAGFKYTLHFAGNGGAIDPRINNRGN